MIKHILILVLAAFITATALILNSSQTIERSLDYYTHEIAKRDSLIAERDSQLADYQAVMVEYYTATEVLLDSISCYYDDFLDVTAETDVYSFYCISADKLDSLLSK